MKQRNVYRIVVGGLMLASGFAYIFASSGDGIVGSIFVTAGIVFLLTGLSRHMKYGDSPESDERSRKIGAFGLSYAWLTGLFFIFCLFWLDLLNIVKLGSQLSLALSILVLTASGLIFQMYLFWKGDAE